MTEQKGDAAAKRQNFHHPYTPYPIQLDFMNALYNVLEDGCVGIFESPTGILTSDSTLSIFFKGGRRLLGYQQLTSLESIGTVLDVSALYLLYGKCLEAGETNCDISF